MRRTIILGALALALAMPGSALAKSQLRHFEGTLPPADISKPGSGGMLRLDLVFKDKHGRGKFTPRQLVEVNVEDMPFTFCTGGPGQPTSQGTLTAAFPAMAKFKATARKPGQAKPKANSYSYSTSYSFTSFAGTIGTRIYKANGKGPVLSFSTLTVDHYDFPPPGPTNCSSNGPRGASGTQCRRSAEANPLPLCRID